MLPDPRPGSIHRSGARPRKDLTTRPDPRRNVSLYQDGVKPGRAPLLHDMPAGDPAVTDYLWTWQIRRTYFVLMNPSGRDQIRVARKNLAACAALVGHEKKWGEILDRSRRVQGAEVTDLLATLRPFVVPTKRKKPT